MKALGPSRPIDLTGYLMPWRNEQPVWIAMEGRQFLPVFSTLDRLIATMDEAHAPAYTVKEITDGFDFLDSVQTCNVCVNLRRENGQARYALIVITA